MPSGLGYVQGLVAEFISTEECTLSVLQGLLKDPDRPVDRLVIEARQGDTNKLTLIRDAARLLHDCWA